MKLRLIAKQRIPYGGSYVLSRSDKGLVGRGLNFDMLRNNVVAWRKANGIATGLSFDDDLEQAVCEAYPKECQGYDPNLPDPRRFSLNMDDVLRGTKAMIAFKLAGSPLVPRAEAERRAKICSTCPYNVRFHKPCAGLCPELLRLVTAIIGAQGTPYDNELFTCGVCHCFTKAHVWVPYEILNKGLNDQQRTQFSNVAHCWKKPGAL